MCIRSRRKREEGGREEREGGREEREGEGETSVSRTLLLPFHPRCKWGGSKGRKKREDD